MSEQEDFAVMLLGHLSAWRMRAIERIELSSALWSVREREIHIKPLSDVAEIRSDIPGFRDQLDRVISQNQGDDGKVELLLPIAELPKVPLIDLHITVDKEPVYRIPLDHGARLEAEYIKVLADRAGIWTGIWTEIRIPADKRKKEKGLLELLAAIFFLPISQYGHIWKKCQQLGRRKWRHPFTRRREKRDPVEVFLEMFLNFEFKDRMEAEWRTIASLIQERVAEKVTKDYLSGAEYPLIALPQMAREMKRLEREVLDVSQCDERLKALQSLLQAAKNIEDAERNRNPNNELEKEPRAEAASELLSTYAAFGTRWTAFARCRVPVDRPFIITIREKRSIYFQRKPHEQFTRSRSRIDEHLGKTAWMWVAFADAETNHISIHTTDTSVRLHGCQALDELGKPLEEPLEKLLEEPIRRGGTVKAELDEESKTSELYLRHDSNPERPKRIWIKCDLRLNRNVSLLLYLAMAVTAFGISVLIWRAVEGKSTPNNDPLSGLTAKDVAVILLPVAFVAAFLIAKENSTLTMRLRRLRQWILLVELFILLGTAFFLYVIHRIYANP